MQALPLRRRFTLVLVTMMLVLLSQTASAADFKNYADTAASKLVSWYNSGSGLWNSGWWQSANHVTTLLDYMQRGGSNDYTWVVDNTFEKQKNSYDGSFRNEYLDDTGWWGLAWLRAYDKTGDTKYRDMAKITADHMHDYWDNTCGGGVWWTTARGYKNAITIELYIKLNAAYYNRSGNGTYLSRAQAGWTWFVNSGMINGQNLVNDGLTSSCQNNNEVTWTYNQGVVLGAAVELHIATNDGNYLNKAQQIASATRTYLVHGITGALRENGCESGDCGNDGALFKGIFMRNLYELNARQYNQANRDFIELNAASIWDNSRSGDQFGLFWSGPYTNATPNTQSAALDAFNGAIQYGTSGGGGGSSNLALNRPTNVNGQCAGNEAGPQGVDGTTSSKWCAQLSSGVASLQVDIGSNNVYSVRKFVVKHAETGGENSGYNTRDFRIQGSSDASTWYDLITVNGNTSGTTTHTTSAVGFRYFRLYITNPQSNSQYVAARIYEFEIYEN
ncbi:MAG: discoidin domain-containing protein [Armatimonadetes bacterium]|nr:discoidin domain-containing protein [Anaerolineae bacterium]